MRSPEDGGSFSQWAALYVSGVLLVVLVTAHLFAVHYASGVSTEGYSFAGVTSRLDGFFYPLVDISLLVLALVHGLVGMHRLVADLGLGPRSLRAAAVVLAVAGLWGLYYGIRIFRAFSA